MKRTIIRALAAGTAAALAALAAPTAAQAGDDRKPKLWKVDASAVCAQDGSGGHTVTWTVTNLSGKLTLKAKAVADGLAGVEVGDELGPEQTWTISLDIAADAENVDAWVKLKYIDKKLDLLVPERPYCKAKPGSSAESTCDNLIVTLANSDKATRTARFTLSVDGGDPHAKVDVAPGEQETVEYPTGVTVLVASGKYEHTHTWERPEGGCAPSPTPTATAAPHVPVSNGGGDELPVTGPGVPALVSLAGVLLAAGAGIAFVVRRRRVRFQA